VNDILKQRLVGALILLALGVVFWPIIFVEPGERIEVGPSSIPPRPQVDTTPIEPPDPEQWRGSADSYAGEEEGEAVATDDELVLGEPEQEEVAAAVEVPRESPNPVRAEAPESPALDDNGVPIAWSLQVASVSSAAKAEALREQLLAMKEQAYIRKLERGERDLYRVYVGPKFERARLEQVKARIDARFGVESLIVRYLP
jgi:DedD protein